MTGNMLQTMIQMMQSGRNPISLLESSAANSPRIAQFMGMIRGKSPQQLKQMVENMAAERGVSVNDMLRQLGIATPSER